MDLGVGPAEAAEAHKLGVQREGCSMLADNLVSSFFQPLPFAVVESRGRS